MTVRDTRPTFLAQAEIDSAGWMFEVVFDYEEGHLFNEMTHADQQSSVEASTIAAHDWKPRPDPFFFHIVAGFEVRTLPTVPARVDVPPHSPTFPPAKKGYDGLVRSTDFTYSDTLDPTSAGNPIYTFLGAVTQSGYKPSGTSYMKRSLPPVEFEYSQPIVQDTVQEVDAESLENLPIGLDGATFQWTDLHGEGIPGVLTEQAGAWFYKRNLSPINVKQDKGAKHTEAKFAAVEPVGSPGPTSPWPVAPSSWIWPAMAGPIWWCWTAPWPVSTNTTKKKAGSHSARLCFVSTATPVIQT